MEATFDGQLGQILALPSSLQAKFKAFLPQLYEIESYTSYTQLNDHDYFFFEGLTFDSAAPPLEESKLTDMRKKAMQVYNIEWDKSK